MRWLTGVTAGICAAIAILAAAYGLNRAGDWHEHRAVVAGHLAAIEADPGYPNRDASLRSEREQIDILDREVRKSSLISVFLLALAIAAFVPLWRRAARSFGILPLSALVGATAVLSLSVLALVVVMLSAGVIRG